MINIVVATAKNNVIGADNKLLWHLPADMRFFRLLTTGHIVIMGRKTYDSIGKPLPNRENIIISRDKKLNIEGCYVVNSLERALEKSQSINSTFTKESQKEVFIIGGEQIYQLSINLCQKLYITEVNANFEGDAFFPKIDPFDWKEDSRESYQKDEKNNFDYEFVVYNRIN
ncbi:MAG: dihydrofolate reductase [Bacteroidota bacterium]